MRRDWESMSVDELFELHQLMQAVLREKLAAKKEVLENRMRQLNQPIDIDGENGQMRCSSRVGHAHETFASIYCEAVE